MLERTAINPVTWSTEMGFDQAELVRGVGRTLYVSGQTAMDPAGRPAHEGDVGGQLTLAVDNLERVLTAAGMGLANLVRLNVFATDVDALLAHYGVLGSRLAGAGARIATTMVEVRRLAVPGQVVELEGTAVD